MINKKEAETVQAFVQSVVDVLVRISEKAHDYDQTGPADDHRFAEIRDMADGAVTSIMEAINAGQA